MGTWGPSPFDNDDAADFLERLRSSPSRAIAKALRDVAQLPPTKYCDVDVGNAAWASCELIALAYGQGEAAAYEDNVLDIAAKVTPKEEQRLLALGVLPRLSDRAISELAGLWHEGNDGATFDASLANLRSRLEAASQGPRTIAVPKKGDVLCLPALPPSTELVVVQVVGTGEVAVFEGHYPDEATALEAVKHHPARRVPTSVNKLLRRGRMLASVSVRKDLKGKKLYAGESGAIESYLLATANAGSVRLVSYEEARNCDVLRPYSENELRDVALGRVELERVRSPDVREVRLCARNAAKWAARRDVTTPGPFGDSENLRRLVEWIEQYGIENAVTRFHGEAIGTTGYGRPCEDAERRSYAFAGLVALWRNPVPVDVWPSALADRLPAAPSAALMELGFPAARALASRIVTRDSELRMMWETGPDKGVEFRRQVETLQKALGSTV